MRQIDEEHKETFEQQLEAAQPRVLKHIKRKMTGPNFPPSITPEDVVQQTMLNALKNQIKIYVIRSNSQSFFYDKLGFPKTDIPT